MIRATDRISKILCSMCHATGRIMSRSEAKKYVNQYGYDILREGVYIPPMIRNESIKTEAPYCYRELESGLNLVGQLVQDVQRFSVFAYLGQI